MVENKGENRPHISLRRQDHSTDRYTYPFTPFDRKVNLPSRNKQDHSERLRSQLTRIQTITERLKNARERDLLYDNGTYIDVTIQIDRENVIHSLQDDRYGIEIVNIVLLESKDDNEQEFDVFRVTIFVPEGRLQKLFDRVEEFSEKESGSSFKLISSIDQIKLATLKSFWTLEDTPFPTENEEIWWEVWFRTNNIRVELSDSERILNQLHLVELEISDNNIEFPEHKIFLIKATAKQLSKSVLLLNSLAELRKAKSRASFFSEHLTFQEQQGWIEDLIGRTEIHESSSTICLLDSGVNNGNPLLSQILPNNRLDTINPSWGVNDGYRGAGHGTLMAGIAAYGNLTELLANRDAINLYHDLESVKIFNPNDPNDPKLYGAITEQACNQSVIMDAENKKIFCMAISSEEGRDSGIPSSWSASVDKTLFSSLEDENAHLFFIASGNVRIDHPNDYPGKNLVEEIHDPGQSWNALTVGSYTELDQIDPIQYPGYTPLASNGGMSPSNSTSLIWDNDWPYKPDFVTEGGNLADNGNNQCEYLDDLQLLSTRKDFRLNPLGTFGDTSAATAQAARLAAKVYEEYPELWPETIRALLVHSSIWSDEMLNGRDLSGFSKTQIKDLIKLVGFGVPNLNKAIYSAKNSVSLLAQETIQPFFKESGNIKTNDSHHFTLPWPVEALRQLDSLEVFLNITLSYYIQPNPGKRFSSRYYYQSHGLRFDVKRSSESISDFQKRINKNAREEEESYSSDTNTENWLVGVNGRTNGSIHRDIWSGTARDLAEKNHLIIYPVTGWWRTRKNLNKYNSSCRYSLVVTIDSPSQDIDIYTPVLNQIAIET